MPRSSSAIRRRRRWRAPRGGFAIAAARLACDGDLDPGFDRLLDTRDLLDTPAVTAARTRLINQAPGSDGMQALITEQSRGTPHPPHPRPTPAARKALHYLRDKRAEERRAADLDPLAERAWERAIFVEAPELRSMAAWEAGGERRRGQITDAVVTALGRRTPRSATPPNSARSGRRTTRSSTSWT
ncbi:hypothetical protein [Nonomuraea sp. NPDC050786]|uniref:hypothetical protein n=1 Tax=Nonomuraea sp. NPDC050786 TaxID=3154840 RepID=UPI0033F4CA74